MNQWKFYGKQTLFFLGGILLFAFLFSILQFWGLFSTQVINVILLVLMIASFFIFGIQFGMKATSKGYLEGLKVGFLFLIILFFLNFIFFQSSFTTSRFIYYGLLLLAAVIGSMFGINRKKK